MFIMQNTQKSLGEDEINRWGRLGLPHHDTRRTTMIEAYLAKGDFPDPRYNRARWHYRCKECECYVDQTRILKHLETVHGYSNWYARQIIEKAKEEHDGTL